MRAATAAGSLPLGLVKLPDRMTADERRAAAAAAREWEADRQRTQLLLSRLADRAEAAELALAEARLGGGEGGARGGGGGGAAGLPRNSSAPSLVPHGRAGRSPPRARAAGCLGDLDGALVAGERASMLEVELAGAR